MNILIAILAAGLGRRMAPQHKMLALWEGRPLLEHALSAASGVGAAPPTVIVGHEAAALAPLLSRYHARVLHNPAFETGLASSLRCAVAAAEAQHCDGLLVMLGDMPQITAAHLHRVIAAFVAAQGQAVVRACDQGRFGHPTLLPKALFPALSRLEGDQGAKEVLLTATDAILRVDIGPAARFDLDTPQALVAHPRT